MPVVIARFQGHADKRLKQMLRDAPRAVASKHLRASVSQALTPIAQAVRAKVPILTGALRKSLGKRTRTYRKRGGTVVASMFGVRTKYQHPDSGKIPNLYAYFIEQRIVSYIVSGTAAAKDAAIAKFSTVLRPRLESELRQRAPK